MKIQILVCQIKHTRPDLVRKRKRQMAEAVEAAYCQHNIVMGRRLIELYYRTEQTDEYTVRLHVWTRTRWWQWLLRLFWLTTRRVAGSRRLVIDTQASMEHLIARNPATPEPETDRE